MRLKVITKLISAMTHLDRSSAMGSAASVISINPGHRTTGMSASSFLQPVKMLRPDIAETVSALGSVLGVCRGSVVSRMLLGIRVAFGLLFAAVGVYSLTVASSLPNLPIPEAEGIILTVIGGMTVFGFFYRLGLLLACSMFCVTAMLSVSAGMFPVLALTWGVVCGILCLAGPGRYSMDRLSWMAVRRAAGL